MKNIAIVTGASSGMGREFALSLTKNISVDKIIVIARSKDELEKLKELISVEVQVYSMDLTNDEEFSKFAKYLEKEKPNIKLLINASGYGKFEKTTNISDADSLGMIDLNVTALTKMTLLCLKYMKKGANIINFASVAAFQPVPFINIYAATKAYVLSFSRALNVELKNSGIHVLAVCPFWTKTGFFKRAVSEKQIVKKYAAMYESGDIIKRAWKDLKKNKDVSKFGFIARLQIMLSKFFSHRLLMKLWIIQQDLNKE